MDLFHTITQGIDNVLACHWYDELKNFSMGDNGSKTESVTGDNHNTNNTTASRNVMDTVPGGEDTPYESAITENVPSAKQRGQLGVGPNSSEPDQSISKDRAEKTSDNIRYGQNISESGVGGMTTTSTGSAAQGGYGGAKADSEQQKPQQTRREQGYGPGSGVGA